MRVFISHSSNNAETAAEVCSKIEKAGHSCFLAPRDIRSGHEYAEEIINGIDESDIILLLLSQAANDSPHVLREVERAVSKNKTVIVYKLGEVTLSKSMEYFLMTHQWLNSEDDKDFSEMIRRINDHAGKQTAVPDAHPDGSAPTAEKKTPDRNSRRNIIILAAALILAAAGAFAGFMLARPAPDHSDDLAVTSAVSEQSTDAAESDPVPENTAQEALAPTVSSQPEDSSAAAPADREQSATTGTTPTTDATLPTEAASQTVSSTQVSEVTPTQPEVTAALTSQQSAQPAEEPSAEPTIAAAQVQPGDSLLFGSYNGEPIKWRVLSISEDGTNAVVIANDILTMKAYDAAEGGKYNKHDGEDYWTTKVGEIPPDIQRQIRGDNRWEFSNIRTWLNSDRENVMYSDQAPTSQAMSENRNGYHTEPGFLNGFTKEQRSAIIETQLTTNGTVTRDKVFLISSDELNQLYDADVSVFAKPTEAAVENDRSCWYKVDTEAYGVDDHFWWLRDANPDNSCECYYINISYTDSRIASGSVGLEGYGIRPAMTLDLTSDAVKAALEN